VGKRIAGIARQPRIEYPRALYQAWRENKSKRGQSTGQSTILDKGGMLRTPEPIGRNGSADRRVGGSATARNGPAKRRVGDQRRRALSGQGKRIGVSAGRRFALRSEIVIVPGRDVSAKRRVGVLATEERRIGETACRRIKLCLFDRSSFLALRSQIVIVLVLGFFIIASRATAGNKAGIGLS